MELFAENMPVKLRSHLDKYLIADKNLEAVRQSRNASSQRAIWMVEQSNNQNMIKLKNYTTGLYLTASDSPFLLGLTGKKVIQSAVQGENSVLAEWEPLRDGFQGKLRTREGKFLRANGWTPPWRNSVTHDVPMAGGTYNWILWDIEPVDSPEDDGSDSDLSSMSRFSPVGSFSSRVQDYADPAPSSPHCIWSPRVSWNKKSAMDLFTNAKAVRLRSHHDKYLLAEEDEESVIQDRNGSSKNVRWLVEFVDTDDDIIRLKSCYGKYLTASNHPFLLGMTGCKVLQTLPVRLDSSIEWKPIGEGTQVKLKTRYGNFLRANGGLPPWRNSVTHDVPHRTATQDWILWDVDILEILENPHERQQGNNKSSAEGASAASGRKQDVVHTDPFSSDTSLGSDRFHNFSRQESNDSTTYSLPRPDFRLIYYCIADDNGEVIDAVEEYLLTFKGNNVEELTHKLEEETGLQDIVVCNRSPLNGKLYPLRLQLPPNNATMHVVVVQSSSMATQDFAKPGLS